MQSRTALLKGVQIARDVPYRDADARFSLSGWDGMGRSAFLPIGDDMLSRHALILGGASEDRRSLISHFIRDLRARLTKDDIMVILDATGEYADAFFKKGDAMFSCEKGQGEGSWNLFRELNGEDEPARLAGDITKTLFSARVRAAVDPSIEQAASDLMMALIVYLHELGRDSLESNQTLRELIEGFDADSMLTILGSVPKLRGMSAYLREPGTAQGVEGALQQAARELFQGRMGEQGDMSVRELISKRGGKAVFLRYEAARGAMQGATLSAILDLALGQAMVKSEGNVYVILGDMRVMPSLPRLEDALTLGENTGLRIICASDGIAALRAISPTADRDRLARAFGTVFAMRLNQRDTRDYIKGLYGRRRVVESYMSGVQSRGVVEQVMDQYVIEDDDLTSLKQGECVVATAGCAPFLFKIKKYGT